MTDCEELRRARRIDTVLSWIFCVTATALMGAMFWWVAIENSAIRKQREEHRAALLRECVEARARAEKDCRK